ncbi:MAG: ABC transporter substrate-binding protein [Gemmatimonadaceae bacterium]
MRRGVAVIWQLCLLWLAACGRGELPGSTGEPLPDEEQSLVVGAGEDEFTAEANRQRLGMYPLNASICEPLVRLTEDFRVQPWLATRWEYRGDNTFRLWLRTDVRFHDGRRFDAAAVKFSLDRVAAQIQHSFLSAESVRIVDDSTVDVRPARPNLRLVEQLVHPSYSMVAPGSDPRLHPVCTGPFRFAEYVPRSRLVATRNDDYWGAKARLRRLTFRFIPDENTRVLALQAGEVDAIIDVSRGAVAGLQRQRGLRIASAPPGGVLLAYLALHGRAPHGILGDRVVRRAVVMALDRRALAERILDGHATVVHTVNPPAVLGRHAALVRGLPHAPGEAARLLDAGGWRVGPRGVREKVGRPLALLLIMQSTSIDPAVAEYMQAQLAAVGIAVTIERLDPAAYGERLNSGRFDLDLELPNQNDANPAFLLALRWYRPSAVASAAFMAPGPAYDALVERALAATDHDAVQARAAEAMRYLLDDEAAAIPLAGVYRIYAMRVGVRGLEHPHPAKTHQWWNALWLAR